MGRRREAAEGPEPGGITFRSGAAIFLCVALVAGSVSAGAAALSDGGGPGASATAKKCKKGKKGKKKRCKKKRPPAAAPVTPPAANPAPPVQRRLDVISAGNGAGTVTSTPAAISCGTNCSEAFDEGTMVTLTPVADAGSSFTSWSGACTGTGDCTVTMDAAKSVTATFTLSQHLLTAVKAGSGAGSVTSSPAAGINCPGDCSESFNHGTVVTLTPTPQPGSNFTGWTGACTGTGVCHVTMDAAKSVTATFALQLHLLTVIKTGNGSGTITSAPSGINCGGDCSEQYQHGTIVTLTAVPSGGSTFQGWSGPCSGTSFTCQVTMDDSKGVAANFTSP